MCLEHWSWEASSLYFVFFFIKSIKNDSLIEKVFNSNLFNLNFFYLFRRLTFRRAQRMISPSSQTSWSNSSAMITFRYLFLVIDSLMKWLMVIGFLLKVSVESLIPNVLLCHVCLLIMTTRSKKIQRWIGWIGWIGRVCS